MTNETEGVIKFDLNHQTLALKNIDIKALDNWRTLFKQTGTVGQVKDRYDGYGFGNISQRTERGFLISGTQTGHLTSTSLADYAEVLSWQPETNSVTSQGLVAPSSESLSHGIIYKTCPQVMAVFHLHSPDIWHAAQQLNIAITNPNIAYGTTAMANAVSQQVGNAALPNMLSMGGHEDGIVGYGRSLEETGLLLIKFLMQAKLS